MARLKRDRSKIAATFTELRRRRTPDALLAILEQLVRELGGTTAFARHFHEAMHGASLSFRAKIMTTLLHAAAVSQQQRNVQALLAITTDPVKLLDHFAAKGQLVPALRECFQRGLFDYSTFDPPPPDSDFFDTYDPL